MKYVVEWYTTNSNEVSPEFDNYEDAREYAFFQSILMGVSEAKVLDEDGELVCYFVDGKLYPFTNDYFEDDYDYDEVGYNPYTGGYDEDL